MVPLQDCDAVILKPLNATHEILRELYRGIPSKFLKTDGVEGEGKGGQHRIGHHDGNAWLAKEGVRLASWLRVLWSRLGMVGVLLLGTTNHRQARSCLSNHDRLRFIPSN